MKYRKILSILLVVAMVVSMIPAALAAEFLDMPSNYATSALQAAVDNGLLQGSDGKLNPQASLKRAELATIINRAFGAANAASLEGYTDVPPDAWYATEMAKAVGMKTFVGDGKALNPNASISRQEAFAVLARALSLQDGSASALSQYQDASQISTWAQGPLAAMVSAGYVQGNDGKLNPKASISRADFAVVMDNIVKTYIKEAGTYAEIADGTVMVNVPNVTLKNVTIKGDLLLGDGVGEGDVTLDNVKLEGRLLVRGGGANSVKLLNGTVIDSAVMAKVIGDVRMVTDASSKVLTTEIDGGEKAVVLDGNFTEVNVAAETPVVLKNANVQTLNMTAADASVKLESGKVENVAISAAATDSTVTVEKAGSVNKITTASEGSTVAGTGTVKEVIAESGAKDTAVTTPNTSVKAEEGATGTTAGDKPVAGGDTETTKPETPSTGGGGGGTSYTTYTAETAERLTDALSKANAGDTVKITADIGSEAAYGIYTVNKAIKVVGENGKTVYGSFVVKGDGASFTSLTVQNQGNGAEAEHKNAINAYTANLTIQGCTFISGSAFANGLAIFPSATSVNYAITDNTFTGYDNSDDTWSTAGLLISGDYDMALKPFFGAGETRSKIPTNVNDEAIINGNTFTRCAVDYASCAWTNEAYILYTLAVANPTSAALDLVYAAGSAKVYAKGSIKIDANTVIKAGTELIIDKDATLNIIDSATLSGAGTIVVNSAAVLETVLEKSTVENVKLGADLSIAAPGKLDQAAFLLDLNEKTLTLTGNQSVVVQNKANVPANITIKNGKLVANNATASKANFNIFTGCALTFEDLIVEATGSVLFPQGDAASVTVTGCDITTTGVYVVATNAAKTDNYNVAIVIDDSILTTTATDKDNCALMINVAGTMTVTNSTITGNRQAVIVRAGTATFTDCTISAQIGAVGTGTNYYDKDWGSGNELPYGAVVVGKRNVDTIYAADASLTMTRCKLSCTDGGAGARYASALYAYNSSSTLGVTVAVEDCTVLAGNVVNVTPDTSVITGMFKDSAGADVSVLSNIPAATV